MPRPPFSTGGLRGMPPRASPKAHPACWPLSRRRSVTPARTSRPVQYTPTLQVCPFLSPMAHLSCSVRKRDQLEVLLQAIAQRVVDLGRAGLKPLLVDRLHLPALYQPRDRLVTEQAEVVVVARDHHAVGVVGEVRPYDSPLVGIF